MQLGDRLIVQEVGLRDGLQSIDRAMPTEAKRAWIAAAHAAGVRHIEVASFVPPRLLPQMADAREIVTYALTLPDLQVTALAPNMKGAESALRAGAHRIIVPVSVSGAHSLANVRKTPAQMIEEFQCIRELRDSEPVWSTVALIAGLSTAFGCTYQGYVDEHSVHDMVLKAIDAGADVISLADTTGHATPQHVRRMLDRVLPAAGDKVKSLHFHDTRGLALANTLAALDYGIREFDASLAGLGGCPHSPGATGNVTTEDLVYMLHSMGYETGIDLRALVSLRDILKRWLPDAPLYGYIARPGLLESAVPQHLSANGVNQ